MTETPGRVNLLGEHTDYNGGYVLPTPIPQSTRVAVGLRHDARVAAWSANVSGPEAGADFILGEESRRGTWIDYVQGVAVALRRHGVTLRGFDLAVSSHVPAGAGLASSAALLIGLVHALARATGVDLEPVTVARLGRTAENEFVGVPCGIMDHMVCALAPRAHALFLDTRTLASRLIPLPSSIDLVIIDSGVSHRLTDGGYTARQQECAEAARRLGVRELRDVDPASIERLDALPAPLRLRARHVVTENQRVLDGCEALDAGDVERFGRLMHASHESQRDDFAVSVAPVDRLVALASSHPDVYGARLTGGGFGGSIVALARAGTGPTVARAVAERYERDVGVHPRVLVPV